MYCVVARKSWECERHVRICSCQSQQLSESTAVRVVMGVRQLHSDLSQ